MHAKRESCFGRRRKAKQNVLQDFRTASGEFLQRKTSQIVNKHNRVNGFSLFHGRLINWWINGYGNIKIKNRRYLDCNLLI
jgi:hypothetical protein